MNIRKNLCLLATLSPLLFVSPLLASEGTSVSLIQPKGSNSDGEYNLSATGESTELSLVGGSDINISWIMAKGSPLLHTIADFTQGETLKIAIDDIHLEGHRVHAPNQVLHITLTPDVDQLPYRAERALSLEIRGDGAFRMGIRSTKSGWPSRVNGRSLGEGNFGSKGPFSGLEIVVSPSSLRLQVRTTDGNVFLHEVEKLGDLASWSKYGMNIVLQKTEPGPNTQLISTIGRITVSKEN